MTQQSLPSDTTCSPTKADRRQPDTLLAADTYGISQYLAEPLIASYLDPWTTANKFSFSKPQKPRGPSTRSAQASEGVTLFVRAQTSR